MRRHVLALLLVLVLASSARAQTAYQQVDLRQLGLGPIFGVIAVELDGAPGAEYLVKTGANPFSLAWVVIYPQEGGCKAGPVTLALAQAGGVGDTIADTNGDGVQEIVRFDVQTQKVTWLAFPACPPR